jgi:3-hydroxyisobutyrate dehydrogenase-like beta-hydroxyacid dehydrogenase
MTDVAVLGLGPMGQALASAALAAGCRTAVWNRTPSRAAPLVARGAVLAATPAEATERAEVTICCVLDYPAVHSILAGLPPMSGAGPETGGRPKVFVNLTTGHPGEARALASPGYLDGAILTPAPTVGTPAATILTGGPREVFERCRPVLDAFAGTVVHLGADTGAAAAYEMALLDLFAVSVGGLAHAFALALAEGIDPAGFARFAGGIGSLLPDMAGRFAAQLAQDRFPGHISSIDSARSAVAHVTAAAAAHGLDPAQLHAVGALLDRATAAGHGDESYARLTRVLLAPR